LLAHCKHLAAHSHPAADMLIGGVRGHLSRSNPRCLALDYEEFIGAKKHLVLGLLVTAG
jgi:hypothetical protein